MATQLAAYLRELRENKGYSTRQLAAVAKCSQGLITAIENGGRSPSLLRLWDITQALEGDFNRALYYLCVDIGIPAEAVERLVKENGKNQKGIDKTDVLC